MTKLDVALNPNRNTSIAAAVRLCERTLRR
jgi:hypothetical protein